MIHASSVSDRPDRERKYSASVDRVPKYAAPTSVFLYFKPLKNDGTPDPKGRAIHLFMTPEDAEQFARAILGEHDNERG